MIKWNKAQSEQTSFLRTGVALGLDEVRFASTPFGNLISARTVVVNAKGPIFNFSYLVMCQDVVLRDGLKDEAVVDEFVAKWIREKVTEVEELKKNTEQMDEEESVVEDQKA